MNRITEKEWQKELAKKELNSTCSLNVWLCDKDSNYSQYGGNALQAANYTNQNFLRGRQTSKNSKNRRPKCNKWLLHNLQWRWWGFGLIVITSIYYSHSR